MESTTMSRLFCPSCNLSRSFDNLSEVVRAEDVYKVKEELSSQIFNFQAAIIKLFQNYIATGGELSNVLKEANIDGKKIIKLNISCAKCGEPLSFEIYPYYEAYCIAKHLFKQEFSNNLERTGLMDLYSAAKKHISNYADGAVLNALLNENSEEVVRLKRSIQLRDALPPESGGGEEQVLIEIAKAIGFGIVGNLATDLLKLGFKKAFSRGNISKRKNGIDNAINEEIKKYNKYEPKHNFSAKEIRTIKRTSKMEIRKIVEDTIRNTEKKITD